MGVMVFKAVLILLFFVASSLPFLKAGSLGKRNIEGMMNPTVILSTSLNN